MLLAIELVYMLIAAGRLTNADTGLMNGTILALGTFTSGVHTNWRVAVIGAALGLGTAAVGYVEQYSGSCSSWRCWRSAPSSSSPACAAAARRRDRTRRARAGPAPLRSGRSRRPAGRRCGRWS